MGEVNFCDILITWSKYIYIQLEKTSGMKQFTGMIMTEIMAICIVLTLQSVYTRTQ